jgi:hypothetical protein
MTTIVIFAVATAGTIIVTSAINAMNPPKRNDGKYAYIYRFLKDAASRLTPFIGNTFHLPVDPTQESAQSKQ